MADYTFEIAFSPVNLFAVGIGAGLIVMSVPLAFLAATVDAGIGWKTTQTVGAQPPSEPLQGIVAAAIPPTPSCGSGGCGCGGGAARKPVQPQAGIVQTEPTTGTQLIQSVYTYNEDMVPNTFTVKKGAPVKLVLDVKENGEGCMSTVTVPGLTNQVDLLTAGQKIIMEFTPTEAGDYPITCAMGVPRGSITVI